MKKIKKIILAMIIFVFVSVHSMDLSATNDEIKEKQLDIYAQSALLMDADSGRVLLEKKGYEKMPMASTTKIMTCIVVLENANLNDIVTVSQRAAKAPDVQLNIRSGQQYILKDLLYSLMLESHNDSAVALAEHVGGSVEGFAELMNQKAKELGANNTNFVTPNGLDADEHYTTAYDLAKISAYAIQNKEFIKITNTKSYSFSEVNNKRTCSVNNKNRFLSLMNGAIGIKTGFTGKAGYCFVGAINRENRKFISVVLASGWPPNKNWKWNDTQKIMNYGLNNYYPKSITDNIQLQQIKVTKGIESQVDSHIELEANTQVLMKEGEEIQIKYNIPEHIEAPIGKDQTIGSIGIYIDETLYKEYPVLSNDEIRKIDFKYCIKEVMNIMFPE